MNYYETLILCQPDGTKSCSACCGLFNFTDISRETLSRFLADGAARSSSFLTSSNITDQGDGRDIRDTTSYICPHQGLVFNKRPGCLLHPQYRNATLRNSSFFGENICSGFLCPAHALLSADHKRTIIELVDDWYLYSIAVIDPDSTAWLLDLLRDRYPIAFQREDVAKKILSGALAIHARHLNEYRGPVFYYSVSEYELGKKNFAIPCDSAANAGQIREILEIIEGNL
ncbi:MAG TPA: hypothetical protein PLM53_10670 [Spirochaetota bacterium]|nr:hypothetical protein [Spirochaetota bacterium]HPC39315.1 hypothetical protein [Spirochaetota bacterium]HPL15122.1 hypothetical protein [Spirochaetota bacterium]HQF08747.1 hypothetical protein [Spirochaetota bacterium]HQH97552.1 hypothetical protein [Spirochaetota bacterium]